MFLECPHCFTRVGVLSDGICPACQKDVHNAPKENASRTSLTIEHGAHLPPICFECGKPTDRYVEVKRRVSLRKHEDNDEAFDVLMGTVRFFSGFAYLILWILHGGPWSRRGELVVVYLPQCELCSTKGPPEPAYVSPEERSMEFVVNKVFKQEVKRPQA